MSHTFHRPCDSLPVYNIALTEHDYYAEPLLYEPGQHLNLHLSHHLGMNFLQLFIPHNMQLGVLLFQLLQFQHHLRRIDLLRKLNLIV